jgi:hypothetical protein
VLTEREEPGEVIGPQESQAGKQRAKGPVLPDRDLQVLGRIIAGDSSKNESTDKIDANVQKIPEISEGLVQAPVAVSQSGFTKPSGPNIAQSGQQNPTLGGIYRSAERTKEPGTDPRADARAAQEVPETAAKPADIPAEDNPIQLKGSASGRARDNKTVASSNSTGKTGWISRALSGRRGLAPNRTPEPEETASPAAKEDTEKFLIRYLRHKTFSYQRGFWVDYDYKPEEDMYRVTHLVRGSKEFESLLGKEPQLKEFFSLGKIILVWHDRIYRVSDR